MTDKEFRQLKRSELIDIIYEYQKQEKKMLSEIRRLRSRLQARELKIEKAGSIAEATVGLAGVFEAAQTAADEYLAQIEAMNRETGKRCEQMLQEARAQADEILIRARAQAAGYPDEEKYKYPLDEDDYEEPEEAGEDFEYIDC